METVYFILYWLVVGPFFLYITTMVFALLAVLVVVVQAEAWEVDPIDPLNKKKAKKVIRRVEPFEILVVTKGGKPVFPIIDMNENRLTVAGYVDGSGCLNNEQTGQWKVKELDTHDTNGSRIKYPEIIQSEWGWLDPIYVFRKLVFILTQRHVVRVMVPFFIAGFYELYSPHIMPYTRARAKKADGTKIKEGTMVVLDEVFESNYQVVSDKSDHLKYISPMRFITNTMPTKDGFSLRADVTLIVKVEDIFKIVSLKDWSEQLQSAVDNALSQVFRTGTLDTVYAVSDEGKVNFIQDKIKEQLIQPSKVVEGKSFISYLGFVLEGVTLNDLIPADKHAKDEIERIMSIQTEGRKTAIAAGKLIEKQVAKLKETDAQTRSSLASITAAQKAGGKIDWIMNQGGSERGDTDKAILTFLKRINEKLDKDNKPSKR
jgi:antitoxin (DNA-binding transcriptional repressor) of toxin-antitoxin stability system